MSEPLLRNEIKRLEGELNAMRRELEGVAAQAMLGSLISSAMLRNISDQSETNRRAALAMLEHIRSELSAKVGDRIEGLPELQLALAQLASLQTKLKTSETHRG
ncbi:hypothetical protein HKD24_06325 [Gluconobacter sp. LMG 31484]|uniref:Mobilization protein n=1 Tax=Gluconobacter vitians TaxID=2728102 RepID=A0ABR9Y4G8_9PROT|nr:hypothetical protein [Gluconobacter vitians]MBF0858829.1 hypothetical protein [Gluconobacter vitians]